MAKKAIFQDPIFHNEDKAREALEAELWPNGVICRHCGNADQTKIAKMQGKSHRRGLYYCNECKDQFTVTVGTVLERSKVPLTKWLMAAHMINTGKNGASAHEIHRNLGVTYKTAWFMMHRLREAMKELNETPMGGKGKSVQADETYYGNTSRRAKGYKKGLRHKQGVFALIEPKGRVRTFHLKPANLNNVRDALLANVDTASELHTDEAPLYEQHLQRYLNEFQFRHNHRVGLGFSDGERTAKALRSIEGRRLTYRPTNGAQN